MKNTLKIIIAGFIGGLASLFIYRAATPTEYQTVVHDTLYQGTNRLVDLRAELPMGSLDFTSAAAKSLDAVVHVKTVVEGSDEGYVDPWMHFFFGSGPYQHRQPQMGSGSGVILSDDGYIVTNNHVIEGADKVAITLNNKKTYKANVVGTDPTTDLALIKIDDTDLPYLDYGNSDHVRVGEWVLAVGNPFNLNSTVTAGIVSAKGRDINILRFDQKSGLPPIESFIQTDAAVNPGNSGGALVDTRGNLVGINAAIKSNTGSFTGYSFAIPVNIVKKVVGDLKEFGTVQRAFIGVTIQNIDEDLADREGIDDLNGVYVNGLVDEGAAKKAGIKKGDIITSIAGAQVTDVPELQEQISKYRPGDKVVVGLMRDGEFKEYPVELKNRFGEIAVVKSESLELKSVLGANFETAPKDLLKKLDLEYGVKVSDVQAGKLRKAGIRDGFIITRIDNVKIYSESDIYKVLEGKKGGVLVEGKYVDGTEGYYGFGL